MGDWPKPPKCDSAEGSPSIQPHPPPSQPHDQSTSGGSLFALRLQPGEDLKSSLLKSVEERGLRAAAVLTCVGSLRSACLRLANATAENPDCLLRREEMFEICSLVGTLEAAEGIDGKAKCHLHASLADKDGRVLGGHVMPDCRVNTTAEIVLVNVPGIRFSREHDIAT